MQLQIWPGIRIVARFAAAVAGLTLALASQGRAETLKLLSSWAENDRPSYVNALIFQKHVKDVSEGKLTITINGPEAVPPFEQLPGSPLPRIPSSSISTNAVRSGSGASLTSTIRRRTA